MAGDGVALGPGQRGGQVRLIGNHQLPLVAELAQERRQELEGEAVGLSPIAEAEQRVALLPHPRSSWAENNVRSPRSIKLSPKPMRLNRCWTNRL